MQRQGAQAVGIQPATPLEWDRWLCEIEQLWQDQTKEEVVRELGAAFRSVEPHHLHAFVLHLLDKSQDLRRSKPSSLGLVILKEFSRWVQRHGHRLPKDLGGILTDTVKLQALRLATSGHINLFDPICDLYHLSSDGNEFLAAHLRVLIARKQFKEAGVCAYKLQLQHCFKIDEICLPLVFQDKVNLVEKYIQGRKDAQIELIQRLDSFCGKDSDLSQVISQLDVPGTRKEKLRPKYLSKLILRLTKLYKLDSSICPNTQFHRDLGAVRYLLYKKYIEQSLDAENWDELVSNTIRDNKALQEEFINQLLEYNDLPAAAKWALHYGIDRSKLSAEVLGEIEKPQDNPPPSDEVENWDDDLLVPQMPFYQLNLPPERIVMVDNLGLLKLCEAHIFQDDQVVGIDMEWTPSFTAAWTTRVAVVQLATYEWVYLLDLPVLMTTEADTTIAFFQNFLSSIQVLKLGFGISGDLQMLGKSYPSLKGPISDVQRMVDVHTLSQKILQAEPSILERAEVTDTDSQSSSVKGLSELTLMCFGRPLDKKEQLSDWEKRPLRPSQTQYAALDAFCLLEIYSFLKAKVSEAWLDVDMEPSYSSKKPKKSKTKTKESKRPKPKYQSHGFKSAVQESDEPLRPGDLSVVCDTMLQGLGKQLRACGVDVKILETTDDHDEAAKIAFKEGRMILTSGTPYQTLKSQVGEGKCLTVDTSWNARQQVVQVLEHFNVRVRQGDVFSRCQVCNGNVYVQVSIEDMRRLWQRKKELLEEEGIAAEIGATSEGPVAEIPTSASNLQSVSDQGTEASHSSQATPAAAAAAAAATSGASVKYLTRPVYDFDSDDDDTGLCIDWEDDFEGDAGDYYDIAYTAPDTKSSETTSTIPVTNANSSQYSEWDSSPHPQITTPAENQTASEVPQRTYESNSQLGLALDSSENDPQVMPPLDASCRQRNPQYNPPTDVDVERTIDFDKVTVGDGVPLQVELIPEGILEKVQNFFCCSQCGKAFWEGTHFDRVVAQFSHVLDLSSDPSN